MHFDFSAEENAFFSQLEGVLEGIDSGSNWNGSLLLAGVQSLARAGYFCPGLKQLPGVNAGLALFKARGLLAGHDPALFLAVEMGNHLLAQILGYCGGQDEILGDILNGKQLGTLALLEDNFNFCGAQWKTELRRDAGGYVLNGYKRYLPLGQECQWLLVAAGLEEQLVLCLVGADAPGVEFAEPYAGLGFDGLSFVDVTFGAVKLDQSQVVVPRQRQVQTWLLDLINQVLIAGAVGVMHRAFAQARSFAVTHFNGGKPIIAYQEVGFKLAEMLTVLQTAELIGLKSAWLHAAGNKDALEMVLTAKVFCGEALEKLSSEALQIMSGQGFFVSNYAELAYRCAKYFQIAGSSAEVSRVFLGDLCLGYSRL